MFDLVRFLKWDRRLYWTQQFQARDSLTDSLNRGWPDEPLRSRQPEETAHRTFFDTDAVEWKVWEVTPSSLESASGSLHGFVEPALKKGWLCFESAKGEKRRLAPVPSDWARLTFHAMIDLWRRATPAKKLSA